MLQNPVRGAARRLGFGKPFFAAASNKKENKKGE